MRHDVYVLFKNVPGKSQVVAAAALKKALGKVKLPYSFEVRDNMGDSGILLDVEGRLQAEWPDQDGGNTIRVRDEHGNVVERVDRTDEGVDGARWKELRDLMPDDALYFQPDEAGDPECGTSAAKINSFDVYRDYENAEKAHPDCEISGYCAADIEEPRFLDVKEPNLYWNKPEEG